MIKGMFLARSRPDGREPSLHCGWVEWGEKPGRYEVWMWQPDGSTSRELACETAMEVSLWMMRHKLYYGTASIDFGTEVKSEEVASGQV